MVSGGEYGPEQQEQSGPVTSATTFILRLVWRRKLIKWATFIWARESGGKLEVIRSVFINKALKTREDESRLKHKLNNAPLRLPEGIKEPLRFDPVVLSRWLLLWNSTMKMRSCRDTVSHLYYSVVKVLIPPLCNETATLALNLFKKRDSIF